MKLRSALVTSLAAMNDTGGELVLRLELLRRLRLELHELLALAAPPVRRGRQRHRQRPRRPARASPRAVTAGARQPPILRGA
jgi:hypothetical protein